MSGRLVTAIVGGVAIALCGCQTVPHPEPEPVPPNPSPRPVVSPPTPDRTPPQVDTGPSDDTGMALPNKPEERDREQIAELVAYYRLDQVNMVILSREGFDEHGLGDELAQRFREAFSELGMRVQNAAGASLPGTDRESIGAVAGQFNADLVTVVLGKASERDRFGNFLSYEADVRGTVYEAGGDIVATREITTVGKRSTDAGRAAESALLSAADDLGPYLVEQIIRKTGQNVVTRRVTITGVYDHATVMQLIAHLKKQPGINDVRLLSWDKWSHEARLLVYMQPAARPNLGGYLTGAPDLRVRIKAEDERKLDARERRIDR